MLSKRAMARAAALTGALALFGVTLPLDAATAQESPSVALEQASKGEDGSSSAGAGSGNMSSGTAKRDNNGNGGSASDVATAGSASGTGTAPVEGEAAPLPENAELLNRLGILDDVTTYGIDVLVGMDIPVELLPEPEPVETAATAPADVNTGGSGTSGAPAGGSTSSAAEDGTGEKVRDRPRKDDAAADGSTTSSADGSTNGTTATDSATGSDGQQ